MSSKSKTKLDEMVQSPYRFFDGPFDVVKSSDLSRDDKLAVLGAMEQDARLLEVATEENMSGGERPRLEDILDAQRRIEGVSHNEEQTGAATKTG